MSKKPKEQKFSDHQLEVLKKKTTDLPGLLEYAHTLGGFSVIPTEQGVIKGNALKAMGEQTQMQLDMLYEQMKLLASQAQKIKERMEVSEKIYHAEIRFEPVVGEIYHLYEKIGGQLVLSILSPVDWREKLQDVGDYKAKVKLLADKTWMVLEKEAGDF